MSPLLVSFTLVAFLYVRPIANTYLSSDLQDEAFELGLLWSRMYEPHSQPRKLIGEIMDTYYLVNVVHNDFTAAEAIFKPFYKATGSEGPKAIVTNGVNGHKLTNGVNGVNGHAH